MTEVLPGTRLHRCPRKSFIVNLTPDNVLNLPPLSAIAPTPRKPVTLEEVERQHILAALEQTKWRVGGQWGAAVRLGVKRTTLISTMSRLGISRPSNHQRTEPGDAGNDTHGEDQI
jgi:transcriptional regulator with GAF, ATPase, and Fis domain